MVGKVQLLGAQQRFETIERSDRTRLKNVSEIDERVLPDFIRTCPVGTDALIQKSEDAKEGVTDARIIEANPVLPMFHKLRREGINEVV